MNKHFTYAVIICILFISCKKEAIVESDITSPEIKVVYPTDILQISQGYPLCMKILISDNQSLANVWLEVNDGNGFKKEYAISGRSMEIIEKYSAPSGISGELTAKFFAADESGNISIKEIKFVMGN